MDVVRQLLTGDRRALARVLRIVEDRRPGFREILRELAPRRVGSHRVGVTGAPGVGKSTLVSALVREARARDRTVGILAVDPSSPWTGGALLGDRIRMTEHLGDSGVFVKSMATRGALGGICAATGDALDVLDAAGFDLLIVETAGAGQTDVEVAREAETTILVLAPGAGDGIQAMKGGVMEAGDLIVVNKCDLPGAEGVRQEVLAALALRTDTRERPDVLLASAATGEGVGAILDALAARAKAFQAGDRRAGLRLRLAADRVRAALREALEEAVLGRSERADLLVQEVADGRQTAHDAAEALLEDLARRSSGGGPS